MHAFGSVWVKVLCHLVELGFKAIVGGSIQIWNSLDADALSHQLSSADAALFIDAFVGA